MIKNMQTKREGELLVRELSEKAQKVYYTSDPCTVWAESRSSVDGISLDFAGAEYDDLTIQELQETLEDMYFEEEDDD